MVLVECGGGRDDSAGCCCGGQLPRIAVVLSGRGVVHNKGRDGMEVRLVRQSRDCSVRWTVSCVSRSGLRCCRSSPNRVYESSIRPGQTPSPSRIAGNYNGE